MNRKLLSLITASLMLGSTAQIAASPELFFGALVAMTGLAHIRHVQIKLSREQGKEQESLTTMFTNNALPSQPITVRYQTGNGAESDHPSYIVIETKKINDIWTWQALLEKQLILEAPVTTTPYAEPYNIYRPRFNEARAALIENAKLLVATSMQGD